MNLKVGKSTREAFGLALAKLGETHPDVVVLDGDVNNSTRTEHFAKKYGSWSVLIGRLFPIVPFKVFSIASGITKIPFVPFVIFTIIGVIPRIIILSVFGMGLVKYAKQTFLLVAVVALVVALIISIKNRKCPPCKK